MTDRVDRLLGHICHALREALASAETIIAVKSSKETYQTSGAAYEIEEYDEHFDKDDAHIIVPKWEEVARLHQDLKSYFYHLLSEDPYGVLQPENGDPDDGQVIYHNDWRTRQSLAQAAPSVKDRIREAYKNCLGANAHEWHSDDEDEED
ncbi:hypothetical protein OAory_01055670 [Aspergillus oryzae]|uniref:Uncharacterized protein n=1 Tax=Aspergillus oryzae TaxID=5062 RepID=A0A1S9DL15_ASPOZ|nr:hypothetical protein OAory_01055670 [Aspergillus oryzae]